VKVHTHIHISRFYHPSIDGLNMKLVINNTGLWYTSLT